MRGGANVHAAMWLATGAAVCAAVVVTKSMTPLWFFLIPWLAHLYAYYGKKGGS